MSEARIVEMGFLAYLKEHAQADASREEIAIHRKAYRRQYHRFYMRKRRRECKEVTLHLTPKQYAAVRVGAERSGKSVPKHLQGMVTQEPQTMHLHGAIDCESTIISMLNDIETAYLRGHIHGAISNDLKQKLLALRAQILEATKPH